MFSTHKKYWFAGIVIALAVVLGACSGTLPANLPDSVEIEDEGGVEEIEFSGAIEDLGADGWTVAGVFFDVTNSTEIKGSFEVGDTVKVHALLGPDDQLTAREIEIHDDDLDDDKELNDDEFKEDEDEFTGIVDSISDSVWVIDGTSVAVTGATEIKGDFSPGDLVKIHASLVDGTLTAREIEFAEEDDLDDDEMEDLEDDDLEDNDDQDDSDDDSEEFVGTVESIVGDTWTVDGRTFKVTSDTELDDGVQVGDVVKVELEDGSGAEAIAHEIELANDDDDMDDDSDSDYDDEDDGDESDDDSDDHGEDDEHDDDHDSDYDSDKDHDDDERDDD